MSRSPMAKSNKEFEIIAELICELTRKCNIKEEFIAASFNLSPSEVRFLKLFAFEKSYSVREMRDKLNLTGGRISHIIQSLEAKKLVARIPDAHDKRNVHVKLLPKAQPLIQNLHQNYQRLHEDILKNIKGVEIEDIHASLSGLVDVFTDWIEKK